LSSKCPRKIHGENVAFWTTYLSEGILLKSCKPHRVDVDRARRNTDSGDRGHGNRTPYPVSDIHANYTGRCDKWSLAPNTWK